MKWVTNIWKNNLKDSESLWCKQVYKMLNLRFKYVVASSGLFVLWAVPKANKMIRKKEKYSLKVRYGHAKCIMNHLRKRARTTTVVTGKENIPSDYQLYSNCLRF